MKKGLAVVMSLAVLVGAMATHAGATYLGDPNHVTGDNANNEDTAGTAAGVDDTTGTEIGSKEIPVKIQTVSGGGTTNVYAVSLSATEVTFIWNNTATTIWNPETLKYETQNDAGSWANASRTITVKNYSDVAIEVKPDNAAPTSSDDGITLGVTTSLKLDSAYDGTVTGSVKSGDIVVTVNGTPNNTYVDLTQIATFNLKITRQ